MAAFTGGDKFAAKLNAIAAKLVKAHSVQVGFLEGSSYPDGTSQPEVAAIMEFGATIQVDAHQQTVYRKIDKAGNLMKGGKFVKRKSSNFATDHAVGAHTITIPPRPFMRRTVAKNSPGWGKIVAGLMASKKFDSAIVLKKMGEVIADQIRQSIEELTDPPLAASTVRAKSRGGSSAASLGILGPAKPLVNTGHMLNSVDYKVE